MNVEISASGWNMDVKGQALAYGSSGLVMCHVITMYIVAGAAAQGLLSSQSIYLPAPSVRPHYFSDLILV